MKDKILKTEWNKERKICNTHTCYFCNGTGKCKGKTCFICKGTGQVEDTS